MSVQKYIKLGFSKEDAEFLEKYPRIHPIASIMEVPKEWIDDLFSKMKHSFWIREHLNHNDKQLHLGMCMKRLHHFNLPFDFDTYKNADIDTIEEVFGKNNVRFVVELLEAI